ncbi:MAG: hypothetical protein DRP64_01110 [Verrucomicrobia bacterium]|nr:MAG: hypothetical protein DRP64_01110 [Verrucomicrobiota bacterium]
MERKNKKSIRAEIVAGTTVVLLLVAGATAWAGKNGGRIQLKKDAPGQQQAQAQVQQRDPFRDLLMLQQQMEQLFGNTINPYSGYPEYEIAFNEEMQQPMDLRETPDAYVVQMDLPGLEKSDITIEVKDRVLAVGGTRKQSTKKKEGEKILMQERSVNSFSREIILPQGVDSDAVSAEYKLGVLTITLPKVERDQKTHTVKIK